MASTLNTQFEKLTLKALKYHQHTNPCKLLGRSTSNLQKLIHQYCVEKRIGEIYYTQTTFKTLKNFGYYMKSKGYIDVEDNHILNVLSTKYKKDPTLTKSNTSPASITSPSPSPSALTPIKTSKPTTPIILTPRVTLIDETDDVVIIEKNKRKLEEPKFTIVSNKRSKSDSDTKIVKVTCPICCVVLQSNDENSLNKHIDECLTIQYLKDCSNTKEVKPPESIPTELIETAPPGFFIEQKLDKDMKDKECSICLEEFTAGQTVARLSCFCIYHKACFTDWKTKGKNECPVHAETAK